MFGCQPCALVAPQRCRILTTDYANIALLHQTTKKKIKIFLTHNKLVKNILHPKQKKLPIPTQNTAEMQRLADKLKEKFGTKVSINHKANGKGKIEIEYYSTEEFERLFELFESIK